jgi:hypothetical protein
MTGGKNCAVIDRLEPDEAAERLIRLERGYQRALAQAEAAVGTPEQPERLGERLSSP